MKLKKILLVLTCLSSPLYAENDQQLLQEIQRLQKQTQALQSQLNTLQKKMINHEISQPNHTRKKKATKVHKATKKTRTINNPETIKTGENHFHSSRISVHAPNAHPETIAFYPTALLADNRVVTYIAGTPVVTSPYLGSRPAFDGSDYIVNISSINRDIRLMQQRRRLYDAYKSMGYPAPTMPIIALSGKAEPDGVINSPFRGNTSGDINLGSNEIAVAAALNRNVEAYVSIAYDDSPPDEGPRVNNSSFDLNMGFVNIGNLDKSPLYFTAGQLYVPFGRYSSSMISSPLPLNLARTKTRPVIFGYKSQDEFGPFAAAYVYRSDTILGKSGVGGVNLGYLYQYGETNGEIGGGYISSVADSSGMQNNGANVGTTFGGFGSFTNGNEAVRKTPALDIHGNLAYDRYNIAAEWVGAIQSFRPQDLSFNGRGARPQAIQSELDVTFKAFNRPSSIGIGYQWSKDALALNLPHHRFIGVFNISIWKDTVESIEYKHDIDYSAYQFANGAAPFGGYNAPIWGTGRSGDTISAQIGVYF